MVGGGRWAHNHHIFVQKTGDEFILSTHQHNLTPSIEQLPLPFHPLHTTLAPPPSPLTNTIPHVVFWNHGNHKSNRSDNPSSAPFKVFKTPPHSPRHSPTYSATSLTVASNSTTWGMAVLQTWYSRFPFNPPQTQHLPTQFPTPLLNYMTTPILNR